MDPYIVAQIHEYFPDLGFPYNDCDYYDKITAIFESASKYQGRDISSQLYDVYPELPKQIKMFATERGIKAVYPAFVYEQAIIHDKKSYSIKHTAIAIVEKALTFAIDAHCAIFKGGDIIQESIPDGVTICNFKTLMKLKHRHFKEEI